MNYRLSFKERILNDVEDPISGNSNMDLCIDGNKEGVNGTKSENIQANELNSNNEKAAEDKNDVQNLENALELTCQIDDVITYAVVHNGECIVRDIYIKNDTDKDIDNLILRINSNNNLIKKFEMGIQKIKSEEELHFKNLKVDINADYLASLTEKIICSIDVSVSFENNILVSETKNITALAFDQWPGLQYTPELLVSFAMPNHPVVISLLQLAAKYLDKWTNEPSLAGYQFDDPNRVKTMAAAAYAAIQQKNITYAEPPSSFEDFGQRIRLADAVMEQHLGTCLDMTLLYVACLEAMGLNPIMVMMNGHIFAGVWLIDESFSDMIMDDPSQLEKRMSKGIHEIVVVECTAMCAGKSRNFDEAVAMAERNVSNYGNFVFAIDVKRARSMGISPLPVRIKTDAGFEVQHEDREEKDVTNAPKTITDTFDLSHSWGKEKVTKQMQWERKLLDMSLRNMLINMRMTKTIVPLLSSDISTLEDALSEGEEFYVLPRPEDMSIARDDGIPVEALGNLGPFSDFIALEGKHKRLHSLYTEKELNSCLTKIYRSAKASMEENGASTLYLAMGLLRWFEGKKGTVARYAPVVLIPIDIIRKSANKGYAMRMRDEDAQLNITLLEFLKQNFDIHIQGLNPVPMDEHGLDIPKIFAIIRQQIMNMPMWDIVEVGFIGNFSFSQFVMWNDIHNKSDFLENNKIVHSLITGAVEWDCTIPPNVDTDEAYLPITVDSSQLRAINMAASGVSFVLHGPPGTGKSQTITAMIANALTKGKTILFVAEKMAALEVVQKRLASLGIQDFCMELHSNKATKKSVLDQLKRSLEISASGENTDYNKKIQDIRKMRKDLDSYVKALNVKRHFGKSLRQLMDIYEMIKETDREIHFDHAYAMTLTESDLDHNLQRLERLIVAGKAIGHPHNHPISAVRKREYSQSIKFKLEPVIAAYKSALEKYRDDSKEFIEYMNMDMPVTESDWNNVCKCASCLIDIVKIPDFLISAESVDREFLQPKALMDKKESFAEKEASFKSQWNENFLKMDMDIFRDKYDKANKKILGIGKGKALAALTSELQAYASFTVETEKIPAYLTDIEFYQKEAKEVADMEAALPYKWKEVMMSCNTKEDIEEYQNSVKRQLQAIDEFSISIEKIKDKEAGKIYISLAENLIEDLKNVKNCENEVGELLDLDFENNEGNWIDSKLALCDCTIENASSVKDWIIYRNIEEECRENGLAPVCNAYEEGMPHDDVINVYLRSIYKTIILSVIESEPVLNSFTGTGFNEKIAQFKKLDSEFMDLTKDEMYYKLTHQLPLPNESVQISKELNILRRAISSNGRGISIRSLFEQIPHILTRFCPCMLMSPISVAQYLAAKNDMFDIVIFDEASQLPTCKAVGVLARGKNAVIVGDPNQMPPTSFFAGNTVDEDNLDIEDLDSILDDCLALGMPQTHLQWHYRSRHESLIAFSNNEFYENSMLTFPSVNDREKKVSLVKVNGFFERGKRRVNEGEAKAIVEEIKRRYNDTQLKRQSIGVVTFNISQQTLIEDLLLEEYQKDIEFDNWANVGEEALFVKNLENVQGDERDVILFSVAFGPDAEGKLSLNFGPLNKTGGWKRLNVAVSRARMEMVVFTIMTADMIDLKRTKSKGVEALKDFLDFAEKGRLQGEYVETRVRNDQGIMEQICQRISDAGFKYQKSVGHSDFKVDIAVINPYKEDEYLLGIMLDGESYCKSPNTKDREVAQPGVLKGLGWQLHRVWAMDWWDNKDKEIANLLHILNEKKDEAYKKFMEEKALLTAEGENNSDTAEREIAAAETQLEYADVIEEKVDNNTEETIEGSVEKVIDSEIDLKSSQKENILIASGSMVNNEISEDYSTETDKSIADDIVENRTEFSAEANSKENKYHLENYKSAQIEVTPMSTLDYVMKDSIKIIAERINSIIDIEAPIEYDRLVKKVLRSFNIGRSSQATLDATDKALKKTNSKVNKQSGVKFYWRKDQDYDLYRTYRVDATSDDKRGPDEICQQELKNAVCITLKAKGPLDKETLIKETIRTMGYTRSGTGLVAAVERGIKYGRKTGEIIQGDDKKFLLS